MTDTQFEVWTRGSQVMQSAARYMPHTAGMIAARETIATGPTVSVDTRADVARPEARDRRGRILSVWDKPMREAWPAEREWTSEIEEEYSRFVASIGRGIVQRRCIRLDDCLNNPAINTLHDRGDVRLGLRPDCADLPYLLRSYFAFKRHLPFGFVAAMGGDGGDPRYLRQGVPVLWRAWTDFRTPRAFFDEMPSYVHSGMFRLSPKIEEGDTYAPVISRASVRPGTNYYDTNGHVLVVTDVEPDGGIQFIDAHPGGFISHPHFETPRQSAAGSAIWGGGFRNWRPQGLASGAIARTRNARIADFAPFYQYDHANWTIAGAPVEYDDWVRHALRVDVRPDPIQALR